MSQTFLVRALVALSVFGGAAQAREEPRLVPRPAQLAMQDGEFAIPPSIPYRGDAGNLPARLQRACGKTLAKGEGGIEFSSRGGGKPESYRLQVSPDGIRVESGDAAGLVHAGSTLIQLLCGAKSIPAMTIDDAPQFKWRGVMLDSARHFQSADYVERFVDAMALHKLNVLHWHLTDDQAWRLPITKYPKLVEVGAWRVPAGDAAQGRRIGGFYTHDDVRRIVTHAASLGITVVPEIEMPGHASAAIAAYPELGAQKGAVTQVPSDWGVYANAFSLEESTFEFLEEVLRETMTLFPSQYIHVGGDEVEPTQWIAAGEQGDGHAIQARFTNRIGKFLDANGRTLVGWDEILAPGLAKDAVVMSWRGIDGAVKAAAEGHDTVLSAWPTLYFDNRQSTSLDEPPGRTRVVSLKDVYAFDPLPPSISREQQSHVLGVQGNVWAEHIRTEARMDHMTFPRAAAIAEIGWTAPARREWKDFARRVPVLFPLYDALDVGYAKSEFEPRALPAPADDTRTSRELELCGDAIPIVLEDDGPWEGERAVFAVDVQNPCWYFRGAKLDGVVSAELRVGQVPFNFQIGKARDAIKLAAPEGEGVELEIRSGTCEGALLARVPVRASDDAGVSNVSAALSAKGTHDLCLRFAQRGLDPLWVVDRVHLVRE